MFCNRCGVELNKEARFCPNCGNVVKEVVITRKVKLKKYSLILIFCLILAGAILAVTVGMNIYKGQNDKMKVNKILGKYTKEYDVGEKTEDGKTVITLEAPDFTSIFWEKAGMFDYENISPRELEKLAKENQEQIKEYTIFVENIDKDSITEALASQISYELLVKAIEQSLGAEEDERQ